MVPKLFTTTTPALKEGLSHLPIEVTTRVVGMLRAGSRGTLGLWVNYLDYDIFFREIKLRKSNWI